MRKIKFLSEFLIINLIVLIIIGLSNLLNFRVCLFYNLFHIPCPGCGISRAIGALFKGNIHESIEYSIAMPIILLIYFIILMWNLYDIKKNKNTFEKFINKYKNILIFITVCLMLVVWIRNICNPLLY